MIPDDGLPASILAITAIIFSCALISMADASASYVSDNRLELLDETEDNHSARRLRRLRTRTTQLILSVRAAEISLAMVAGLLCTLSGNALSHYTGISGWIGQALVLFLCILLLLIFGGMVPRRMAAYHPEDLALSLSPLLWIVCALFAPIVSLMTGVSSLILRLAGKKPDEEPGRVTEEDIRQMIGVGEESGEIEEQEMDMINNVFEFDDRTVGEVMTHRTGICAAPVTSSLGELAEVAIESGHSRIPIYTDDLDDIVGIVYAKSLLKYLSDPDSFDMAAEMRRPLYVPESTKCTDLFKLFKDEKTQMAVVVDEYGGTYGVVTMEDLLESIVGNMQDEFDNEDEEILQVAEGIFIFHGNISPDTVEHALDIDLPQDSGYDTLGGMITDLIGYLPKSGDGVSVNMQNTRFTVLEADDRRITRVLAEPAPPDDEEK